MYESDGQSKENKPSLPHEHVAEVVQVQVHIDVMKSWKPMRMI